MRSRAIVVMVAAVAAACAAPATRGGGAEPAAGAASAAPSAAERVVQRQVEAYNRRDLDGFAATYAPDIRISDHPNDLRLSGQEQLRRRYGPLFASRPALHATITRRIVQGDYVIDHELVTGHAEGDTIRAVAIYQVRGGLIANVWFIR